MEMKIQNRMIEVTKVTKGSIALAIREDTGKGPVVNLTIPEAKALVSAILEYCK